MAIVSSSATISGGPSIGDARTDRSPDANREAVSVNSRNGRVTDLAINQPMAATESSTTTATATSANQNERIRSVTSLVSIVTRSAPCTVPPDATGTATYSRSVSRVSEVRVPAVRLPSSAAAISGRVEKSRLAGAAVSTWEIPSVSTITTRAPVRDS